MNTKTLRFALVSALIMAIATASFWYHEYESLKVTHTAFVTEELQPIIALAKENQSLLQELQNEPFTEKGSGILESYLAKIRRDGVAKHADMKQRLDALADNNTAIVTLINAYSPQAKVMRFTAEADKFRSYASAWRDRWNSLMELFMAGGNYPASGVQFPKEFPQAVDSEIVAAK